MINDRNTRPRWSNVNRHPHSAGGAGNPYMATLWQWRMLRPSRACLASTSHLSYLSELSFQSIRQADIWMVFNILVGTVCKGGLWICECVSVCVWERKGWRVRWGKWKWDCLREGRWPFVGVLCVCVHVVLRYGGGCLMKSWVNADTAHAHTHTHTHTHTHSPLALWKGPAGIDHSHFSGSAQNQRAREGSAQYPWGATVHLHARTFQHNQQI